MANQILITETLELSGDNPHSLTLDDLAIDQTTNEVYDSIWDVTNSDVARTFDDIAGADYGVLMLQNLDATNYVKVGPESGGAIVPLIRLLPGRRVRIDLEPSVVLRLQANVASCRVRATMYAK